jgi:hypothetical protein
MPKALNTNHRKKLAKAKDRSTQMLQEKGWKHDGLWWHSPYSNMRYMRREALHVEELRKWGDGESAFLLDKNHSMWVKAEEEEYALTTMEKAAEECNQRAMLKKLASSIK